MNALVTGATGFIGARLCSRLHNDGHRVRALVLPGENTDHIADCLSEVRTGDITAPGSLTGIGNGVDVVFHLAARVLDFGAKNLFYASILEGTKNMLEACAGRAGRFLQVSSVAACGLGRHLTGICEEDPPETSGVPYNDAKLEAEELVRSFNDRFENGVVIVRPSNVVGPRSVWVDEVGRMFLKSVVPLIDGGRNSASLIYVDNLVDGLVLAGIEPAAAGQTYHLRDDWEVTWSRYLIDLSNILGKKPWGRLPFSVAWTLGSLCESVCTPFGLRPPITRLAAGVMGRDLDVDNTKAKKELGWHTRVSYSEAMKEIESWLALSFL